MDVRQAPPRILYITTWTIVIGVLGSLFWLMTAPPAAYTHYQSLFQAAFDLVFGCIFFACGLFYYSSICILMIAPLRAKALDRSCASNIGSSWYQDARL